MKYFLLQQDDNYADEFDISGFILKQGKSKKEVLESLVSEEVEFPCERYFGTNESVEYNSKVDYFDTITVTELTKSEYKLIEKLFGCSYGTFIDLSEY